MEKISFCCSLLNRGAHFLELLESLSRMADRNCELVTSDFCSEDFSVDSLVSRFRGRLKILKLLRPFNRSRGLNAAARAAEGTVLCFIDADIIVPRDFAARLRQKVSDTEAYFPVCYSLREGEKPQEGAKGWWRHSGYGICGMTAANFKAIGEWDESFKRWGGEDDDLFRRAQKKLRILREECSGLYHLWHPNDLRYKEKYHGLSQGEVNSCARDTATRPSTAET